MATITKFEDLEIWQLARGQTQDYSAIASESSLHITQEKFDSLYSKNILLGSKIMSFINYLQKSEYKGQRYKAKDSP